MQSPARARYSPRRTTSSVAFTTLEAPVSAPGRTTVQTIAAAINPPTRTKAMTRPTPSPTGVDDLLTREPHLATGRPIDEIGQGASPPAASSVDLAALCGNKPVRREHG